ncbi:MAG: KpsF/GutQ family sugar-phosphate isomerase [Methylocystis sp.]|uniref:KpsF/GutQ family sugar-phosphate isomerase n=1 Tax=Methylocystis sp. TaxID=1911079 RepID=UPI003DA3740F
MNHLENALNTLEIEIRALAAARRTLGQSFSDLVELIRARPPHGRVVVMGVGKSGHVANKIAATLASTGTPAFFVHPAEAGHGDLGMITQADIVLALSQSGQTDELLRILPYFKRHGVKLAAMTGGLASDLARHAELVIDTSVPEEACPLGLAPTSSTTLALALGDALAICLLKANGFTRDDFARTHPHGKLGRSLLVTIADVMTPFDQAPVTDAKASVKEGLFLMSRGGMGFLIIADHDRAAVGVFTDGDLRRCLDRDLDIKSAALEEVMIRNFASIEPDKLAVEAVNLMENQKISALPVIDGNRRVVGAVNMRQLLRAGII